MRAIGMERGRLARVVRGGRVFLGDTIRVRPNVFPTWSERWQERVLAIALAVPTGAILPYSQLAVLAGVPAGYCRVFPRVLAKLPEESLRRVVSVKHRSILAQWSGMELFQDER